MEGVRADEEAPAARRRLLYAVGALALLLGLAAVPPLVLLSGGDDAGTLPESDAYHALAVAPEGVGRLLLGTREGVYRSFDGGSTWTSVGPFRRDVLALAWADGSTVWFGGPGALARSADGGDHWTLVHAAGLPTGTVGALAFHPRRPAVLYASVRGVGLYRSDDGGNSFEIVSRGGGRRATSLAVAPDGRILAVEMEDGVIESGDGGRTWVRRLAGRLTAIGLHPLRAGRVLAAGDGIFLSLDGGRRWQRARDVSTGTIAWAPSNPGFAYAAGLDGTLYVSSDGGTTWSSR